MTINLLDRATTLLTPEVIFGIADGAAELPETTRHALHTILPVLLGALVQVSAMPAGGERIFAMLREHGADRFDPRELERQLGSPHARTPLKLMGSHVIDQLLGSRRLEITEGIGQVTGLAAPTVGRMMSLAVPLVLGAVGSAVSEEGLDEAGLLALLSAQRAGLSRRMPEDVAALVGATAASERARRETAPTPVARGTRLKWIVPAALALVAIFALPRLLRNGERPMPEVVDPGAVLEEDFLRKGKPSAPAGGSLPVASIDEVARYLASEDEAMRRFSVRGLRFEGESAELSEGAEALLERLAEVISEEPRAVVMITGRADDGGALDEQRSLSARRAEAVSARLIEAGVPSGRVRVLVAEPSPHHEAMPSTPVELVLVKGDE